MTSDGRENERNQPPESKEQQLPEDLEVTPAILARVESHSRPLYPGPLPLWLGSGRSPNGLRLSGARLTPPGDDVSPRTVCSGRAARVRCSRGLGRAARIELTASL